MENSWAVEPITGTTGYAGTAAQNNININMYSADYRGTVGTIKDIPCAVDFILVA